MDLEGLHQKFRDAIQGVTSTQALLEVKARFLGKKGELTSLLQGLRSLPETERPGRGVQLNHLKEQIEQAFLARFDQLRREGTQKKIRSEAVDVTLPGRGLEAGTLHPVTQVLTQVEDIFVSMGFEVCEGPEIETDFYNFEALNIPRDHPARDMQDTFYINDQLLLRTHTSPVQIHVMEKRKPPIRMIAPGVVYRRDSDISHSPMFHQVEGLVVGEGIRFSDLKGTVVHFLRRFFEAEVPVRFRPSYFPFTEPSAEVDLWWEQEGGGTWLEVMGCGMVHPNVFRKVRYDPGMTGFAFGLGIERLAMLKLGIPDIRLFFENDLRFLGQFL